MKVKKYIKKCVLKEKLMKLEKIRRRDHIFNQLKETEEAIENDEKTKEKIYCWTVIFLLKTVQKNTSPKIFK